MVGSGLHDGPTTCGCLMGFEQFHVGDLLDVPTAGPKERRIVTEVHSHGFYYDQYPDGLQGSYAHRRQWVDIRLWAERLARGWRHVPSYPSAVRVPDGL